MSEWLDREIAALAEAIGVPEKRLREQWAEFLAEVEANPPPPFLRDLFRGPMYFAPDGKPCEMHEWMVYHSTMESKIVEQTDIGDWRVSTVYLGIDHSFLMDSPPIIYETMLFDHGEHAPEDYEDAHPYDQSQWRYPTREAAQAMHDQIVQWVRDGMKGEEP